MNTERDCLKELAMPSSSVFRNNETNNKNIVESANRMYWKFQKTHCFQQRFAHKTLRINKLFNNLDLLNRKREVHFLVLGNKQAGKSTLVKQFRICNGDGISQNARYVLIPPLLANLADAVTKVLDNMERLGLRCFKDAQCNALVSELLSFRPKGDEFISDFAFCNCPLSASFLPNENSHIIPDNKLESLKLQHLTDNHPEISKLSILDCHVNHLDCNSFKKSRDPSPETKFSSLKNSPQHTRISVQNVQNHMIPTKFSNEHVTVLKKIAQTGIIPGDFYTLNPCSIDWRNHEHLLRILENITVNPKLVELPIEFLLILPSNNSNIPPPPNSSPPRSSSMDSLLQTSESLDEREWNSDSPTEDEDEKKTDKNDLESINNNPEQTKTLVQLKIEDHEESESEDSIRTRAIRMQQKMGDESRSSFDADTGFSEEYVEPTIFQPQIWRLEAMRKFRIHFKNVIVQPEFEEALEAAEFFNPKLSYADYYFIQHVDRIIQDDYMPTLQDILAMRQPSRSIRETVIEIQGNKCRFTDIAGQKGRKSKWMHHFEFVNSVIYVISVIDYFKVSRNGLNYLTEALKLLNHLIYSKQFLKKEFHVFLTKTDLLEQQLKTQKFNVFFPGFKGNTESASEVCAFIRSEICQKSESSLQKRVQIYECCTLDIEQMKILTKTCLKHIFEIVSKHQ